MLVTLYKIHKVYFRLLGTSGFYLKAEVKNSLLLAVVVLRTSNMKISHRHLADFIKELLVKVCHSCRTIILSFRNLPVIKEIKNAPSALLSYISVWEFLRTWEKCREAFVHMKLRIDVHLSRQSSVASHSQTSRTQTSTFLSLFFRRS